MKSLFCELMHDLKAVRLGKVVIAVATVSILFVTCGDKSATLASQKCSACHAYPDPSLLNKTIWKNRVLPEMSLRMGLDLSKIPGTTAEELTEILKALPPKPMVTEDEWKTIQDFYLREAPDSLPLATSAPDSLLRQFSASAVRLPLTAENLITLVRADTEGRRLFIGTREGKLFTLDNDLSPIDSVQLPSPPMHMLFRPDKSVLLACAGIMDPNDLSKGSVIHLNANGDLMTTIDSIKRPVFLEEADLNNDGRADLLISAFGNFTGGLLAYESRRDHSYQKHMIHNFPGTRRTITEDFNGDGLLDIISLITQGDEKIALFTNRGNFRFSYQVLMRFPPAYGSSYFELVDFNGDGKRDILYTNGDNADYSPILKPYHAVRIFLNDGQNKFHESWFYPMHGASMARAVDFDGDGDPDVAAISFFPDFQHAAERGFVYFRNDGNTFTTFTTSLAASSRWITMEITDLETDGDQDIILGALTFSSGVPDTLFQRWGETKYSLLVLRNNHVRRDSRR